MNQRTFIVKANAEKFKHAVLERHRRRCVGVERVLRGARRGVHHL